MDALGNLHKALDFIISQGDIEIKLSLWESIQKAAEDTQFPSNLQFSEEKELIGNCRSVIKWVTEQDEQKQLAKLSGDLVRLMVDIEDGKDRDITLI
jgi:hypothetical protein